MSLHVRVCFIILIIDIHGHRFEIYISVSEIHENVDIVLWNKNVFKLVGVINLWPQKLESKTNTSLKIDIKFEENSLYQEEIISKAYQRTDKSYFQKLKELESLVNMNRLVQKVLPKQTDIDIILKIIQQRVLKGTHLPVMVKDIQAGYLVISYFKDIYLYLVQNKWPITKSAVRKIGVLVEKYDFMINNIIRLTII